MLDTGVLIRALGHRPSDPQGAVCRRLFDSTIKAGHHVLVAAPSVTEIMRWAKHPVDAVIPCIQQVMVVSLDYQAAALAGSALPMAALKALSADLGRSLTCLKFDALIVGCALRAKADTLVTLDQAMRRKFTQVVPMATPDELLS